MKAAALRARRRRIGGGWEEEEAGRRGPLFALGPFDLRPPPEARGCRMSKAVFSVATVPVGE